MQWIKFFMGLIKLFFIFIFLTSTHTNASVQEPKNQLYNIQDLEVLEQEKSFKEFFSHAKDVRPSKRNKAWKEMVHSMAMQYLDSLKLSQGNIGSLNKEFILDISKWAHLSDDEFFIKKRDTIIIQYFAYCFQKEEFNSCFNEATNFYKKYKIHDEFGFRLLEAINKISFKEQSTIDYLVQAKQSFWPFLAKLVKKPISEFYCAQSPLKEAIEQKLITEIYHNSDYKILDHFHPDCWKVLKKTFIKTVFTHTDAYTRKKVYKIIENNVRLSQIDTQTYTMLQMLSGIKLDSTEVMLFWDRLKQLSRNYELREKVNTRLKAILPLPGNVFEGTTKQQKIIIKAISNYFPEYIDYYSSTCLDHLSGDKDTDGGNPATKCHELFKLSKQLGFIPKSKTIRYTQLTTF